MAAMSMCPGCAWGMAVANFGMATIIMMLDGNFPPEEWHDALT
jgi:hypothetical protein